MTHGATNLALRPRECRLVKQPVLLQLLQVECRAINPMDDAQALAAAPESLTQRLESFWSPGQADDNNVEGQRMLSNTHPKYLMSPLSNRWR